MSDLILILPLFVFVIIGIFLAWRFRRTATRSKPVVTLTGFALSLTLTVLLIGALCFHFWYLHRPVPTPLHVLLFRGVTYIREIRTDPRPMVIHVLLIDLTAHGIRFLVTPGQPVGEYDLPARTTSQFLSEFGLQLAINGGGFHPWHSLRTWDYYPHVGDGVTIEGFASSKGHVYSTSDPDLPTLYISADNHASFERPGESPYNAISALFFIVKQSQWSQPSAKMYQDYEGLHPRTVIGLDKDAHTLILIVVDGRQPNYSEGATLEEMAAIAIKYGADVAVNQDGGGSSAMMMQSTQNTPELLNSPIDSYIPGRERAIGNHLGIFALPPDAP